LLVVDLVVKTIMSKSRSTHTLRPLEPRPQLSKSVLAAFSPMSHPYTQLLYTLKTGYELRLVVLGASPWHKLQLFAKTR
jgi:hypothetical protein